MGKLLSNFVGVYEEGKYFVMGSKKKMREHLSIESGKKMYCCLEKLRMKFCYPSKFMHYCPSKFMHMFSSKY